MRVNKPTQGVVVDDIVETLRLDIISGRLAPGSEINSVDLATRFSTSRTPVREALLILDRYGLVSLKTHKRPRVADVSVDAIRDLYELRRALHVYIADAIVHRAKDEDLAQLCQLAQALLETAHVLPPDEQHAKIEAFLDMEYGLCGNALVIETLCSLKWRIGWFRQLARLQPEQLRNIAQDRLRVVHAYQARDSMLAAALSRAMLQYGAKYSIANFQATWGNSRG